jgi:hypothetical protein
VKIDNIDAGSLKRQLESIADKVKEVLNTANVGEQEIDEHIYSDVYRLSKEMDWYCNKQYPEGGRILRNKQRIIRKAIGKSLPCFVTDKPKSNSCDKCNYRFKCLTTKNREYTISVIKNAVEREREVMSRKDFYENTISETEFEKQKRELSTYLGVDIK